MNRDNAHLYKPFVDALIQGKTIQILDSGKWIDTLNPWFDSPVNFYRIKPALKKQSLSFGEWTRRIGQIIITDDGQSLITAVIVSNNGVCVTIGHRLYEAGHPRIMNAKMANGSLCYDEVEE